MRKILTIAVFIITAQTVEAQTKQETKIPAEKEKLLSKYTCLACHKADQRHVGPAYTEVAKKKYTNSQIVELIHSPRPDNWPGYPPMAPMKQVPLGDALKIAAWINSIAKKRG